MNLLNKIGNRRTSAMSIRTKTTLFVLLSLGVLVVLMVAIQFRTSLDRVENIETEQAVDDADRVARQLENSLTDLGGSNSDWAWWDDTYEFVQGDNDGYQDENLYADGLSPIGVDAIGYVDAKGNVVYDRWFTDDGEVPAPEPLLTLAQPGGLLSDFTDDTGATPGGIVEADGNVFLVSTRAILPSDESGQPVGVLLMAREVDDAFTTELAELVNFDLLVEPCIGESCTDLTTEPTIAKASNTITAETAINAIDGTPVLRTRVTAPRTMYQESLNGIQRVLLIVIAVGIVAMIVTIAGLRRLIVRPLEVLGSTVAQVAHTNDPSLRARVDRSDEIGELAEGVNVMLARLEESQQELVDAKEQIEGSSEAKSRFLSRVSHELRTPINSVLAYAQLLQLDQADGEAGESVEEIITAARHITSLVDEFLDIARIEAGAIPIDLDDVAPATIATEVINMAQPLAAAQTTTIDLVSPDDLLIEADPLRLRQALLNLVSNAIKYGGGDEPITVTVRPLGPQTAIEVRDHGPGIPADQIDRLFVPFDRLDADGSDQKGSGVGLTVTKQLIELMDGSINVASEVGVGTTFTLTLPTARDADTDCSPLEVAEASAST